MMVTLTVQVPGQRADQFLARSVEGLTRSAAQKLIEQGQVTLNGRPGKKNDRLNPGDRVEFSVPEAKPVDIPARDIPLDIVYEDEDVLVINTVVPMLYAYGRHTASEKLCDRAFAFLEQLKAEEAAKAERKAADNELDGKVTAEKNARLYWDNQLSGAVETEKADREAEDEAVLVALNAETEAREAADETLSRYLLLK